MSQRTAPAEQRGEDFGAAGFRLAIVKRAKALVMLPVVAALAASVCVVFIPDRYTASALIQTEPPHVTAAIPGAPLSAETSASEADRQEIDKQMDLLRSSSILGHVSDELHLANDPEFTRPSWLARVAALFGSSVPQSLTRDAVIDGLSVSRVRSTLMVSVQFTSLSAEKSARIANAIAAEYLTEKHSVATASAPAKRSFAKPTASERVFASLLDEYGLSPALSGARIVAAAEPPRRPAGPKRVRIVVTAAVSAFLLALVLALLLEREASLRTRNVEKMLACPHMTSMPAMTANDDIRQPGRAARMIVAEPQCAYAEAVRNACRELGHRAEGDASRVILVASALPGEGSELFASNIAHHFAVDGQESLLVDCDFRAKNLTRLLTPENASGFLDQIAGKEPVENVILRDSLTGIHFLPASGPAPISLSASAALQSAEFPEAVAGLKARFSTIVLSAPPLLSVTDGQVLAELADQIVFLTAWHRTPRALAKRALASLAGNQRKVVGAVLTDISENLDASVMSLAAIFEEMRRVAGMSRTQRAA